MSRFEVFGAKLLLAQVVLLACFAAGEVATTLWLEHAASEPVFQRYASVAQRSRRFAGDDRIRFQPHRYIGYMPRPGFVKGPNQHNSLGYRGPEIELPKPPGEFRIVCLGGSTTYTTSVADDALTYPAQLERMLVDRGHPVRVINSGCAAWSSYETLINFQFRVLDLDPDLIVVYHGVNDIHARVVWPSSAYRGDNSGRRDAVTGVVHTPRWFEHSDLLRVLAIKAGLAEPVEWVAPDRMLYTEGPDTFYAHRFFSQWERGEYPSGPFKQVPVQKMLEAHPPVYFERNLATLAGVARAHGVDVVMATFAHSPLFDDVALAASREYQVAYAEMIASVKRVCAAHDVPCFDFAAVFPRDKEFFDDGTHVNMKGATLKARLFAQFLVAQGVLPPPVGVAGGERGGAGGAPGEAPR